MPPPTHHPEPTAQEFAAALMNVAATVLPVLQAQVAQYAHTTDRFVQAVDRFAEVVSRLEAVEYYRRTGRKPMPAPVNRPAAKERR